MPDVGGKKRLSLKVLIQRLTHLRTGRGLGRVLCLQPAIQYPGLLFPSLRRALTNTTSNWVECLPGVVQNPRQHLFPVKAHPRVPLVCVRGLAACRAVFGGIKYGEHGCISHGTPIYRKEIVDQKQGNQNKRKERGARLGGTMQARAWCLGRRSRGGSGVTREVRRGKAVLGGSHSGCVRMCIKKGEEERKYFSRRVSRAQYWRVPE